MDIYAQLVIKIIKEQEGVIGPIALEQAKKVKGLVVDLESQKVEFAGNKKDIINGLIEQFEKLFGLASVYVCKDAVKELLPKIPQDEVPSLLK